MAKSKVDLPNLSNYTAGGIVDLCAPLQEELSKLKTLTDFYKVGLKDRLTDAHKVPKDISTSIVKGETYYAKITDQTARRFSQDKARELLGKEQFESCFVESPSSQVVRFYILPPTSQESGFGGGDV